MRLVVHTLPRVGLYIASLQPQISSINPLTPFPAQDCAKWSFGQVTIRPSAMSLRRCYYELLLTKLYVNLFVNKPPEMLRRYGIGNIWRIATGSLKTFSRYLKLMVNA